MTRIASTTTLSASSQNKICYSKERLLTIKQSPLASGKIKEVRVKMKIIEAEGEVKKWKETTSLLERAGHKWASMNELKAFHLFSQSCVAEFFYQKSCKELDRLQIKLANLQPYHLVG